MLAVDFHVHSLFSHCGLHTILELTAHAHKLHMAGIAITDHGLTLGGRLNSVFFERFQSPYPDLTVLKGIESNVVDSSGTIDVPNAYIPFIDIVLLGIHPNIQQGLSRSAYTEMLLNAMEKNPSIDVITHPNDPHYPVDYNVLAQCAASHGIALELNNSKILYNRSSTEDTLTLIDACKSNRCLLAVCSDTHAIQELGDDRAVRPLLTQSSFPPELIVNNSAPSAFSFVEKRRIHKKISLPIE